MSIVPPSTRRPLSSVERQAVLRVLYGLMRRRDVSIRQLSRESGLNRPYLDRRFCGDVAFSVDDLAVLAPILGVGVPQILVATATLLRRQQGGRSQEVENARYDRERGRSTRAAC